jgi:nucleotide-binding universal stress UspA family protein
MTTKTARDPMPTHTAPRFVGHLPVEEPRAQVHPAPEPGAVRPVLLAMTASSRPRVALLRALEYAVRQGAPLFVLGCLPPRGAANPLFPQLNVTWVTEQPLAEVRAGWRLLRWCNRILPFSIPPEQVLIRSGAFVRTITQVAEEVSARLVFLPESRALSGTDVTSIVEQSGAAVLLSRPMQPRNLVIAASDLATAQTPVLREGLAVGHTLGGEVTFVHNLDPFSGPMSYVVGDGMMMLPVPGLTDDGTYQRRQDRLRSVAEDLGGDAGTEVLRRVDTADAILEVARRERADLIVVGHRERSWLASLFGESIAANVIDRAARSVLVVPVPESSTHPPRVGPA